MKNRLRFIFVLLVALPLALVVGLGLRISRTERENVRHRIRDLILSRLDEIDREIDALIAQREHECLNMSAFSSLTPAQLRQMSRDSSLIRQYFQLDAEGALIYPTAPELARTWYPMSDGARPGIMPQYFVVETDLQDGTPAPSKGRTEFYARDAEDQLQPLPPDALTADEFGFLQRTREIRQRRTPPFGVATPMVEALQQKVQRDYSVSLPVNAALESDWLTWFSDTGLNAIFWWHDSGGGVAGAELNTVRLMADIVALLPADAPDSQALSDGRIVLADERGRAIYQWGAYQPAEGEAPQAERALSAPLGAWTLKQYASSEALGGAFGRSTAFNILSGLLVAMLGLSALAVYFYRENDRELREARARVSFVNQVSHELKTPLTSIRMYAEMLEGDLDDGDATQRRRLEVIVSESQRLSRLIANVLTFGRRSRDGLRLNRSPGLVHEVVANVIRQFEPVLARKGIRIDCQGTTPREAEFDRDAMEQILGNLLGNAEKYAVDAERVCIHIEQDGQWVRLVVADDGPGIPAKERERIFEPFHRISNKLTDGVTGTGIGLTIARDLARLHGGDLTLEPSVKGACFRLVVEARPTESGEPQ